MDLRSAPRLPTLVGGAFLAAAVVGFVVVALLGGGGAHDDMDAAAPLTSAAADPAAEPPAPAAAGTVSDGDGTTTDDPLVRVPYLSLTAVDEVPVDPPIFVGPNDDDLAGHTIDEVVGAGSSGAAAIEWAESDWSDAVTQAADGVRAFAEIAASINDPDEFEAFLDGFILIDEIIDAQSAPSVFFPASSVGVTVDADPDTASGEDVAPDADGFGPAMSDEPPVEPLLDVCADVPGWCGEGVGATVLLAIDGPSVILEVGLSADPDCVAAFADRDDVVSLDVIVSRPALTIVTSQSLDGSFEGRRERVPDNERREAWTDAREAAEPGVIVPFAVCHPMLVSPDGAFSNYAVTVESLAGPRIGARPLMDDVWTGIVQLSGFGEPPNVRVVPESLRVVRVEVPTTAEWRADLLLVNLDELPEDMGAGDAASGCAAVEALRRVEVDPVAFGGDPEPRFGVRYTGSAVERVEVAPPRGSPPEWRFRETYRIDRGAVRSAICVRWTDERRIRAEEPTVRRRQAVFVEGPQPPEVTAWIVGYQPVYRRTGVETFRADVPTSVEVDLRAAGGSCRASASVPTYPVDVTRAERPLAPLPFDPVELCSFEDRRWGPPFAVTTTPAAGSGWLMPGVPFTGAVNSSIGVACRHVVTCRVVTDVPVHRGVHPDEIRRGGVIDGDGLVSRLVGHVRIAYTIADGGPPPQWSIGLAEEYGETDEQPDVPVLSIASASLSRVETCEDGAPPRATTGMSRTARLVGQACWARTLLVRWSADRPVLVVEGHLMPEFDRAPCRPVRFSGPVGPSIGGTIEITDLCPGLTYALGLDVVDPVTGGRARYGPAPSNYPWPEAPASEPNGWQEPIERIWTVEATLPTVSVLIDGWSVEARSFGTFVEDDGRRNDGIAFKLRRLTVEGAGGLMIRTGHDFGSNGGCNSSRLRASGDQVTEDGRAARLPMSSQAFVEVRGMVLQQLFCWTFDPTGNRTTHGWLQASFRCSRNWDWAIFASAALLDDAPPARIECGDRFASVVITFDIVPGSLRPPARAAPDGSPPLAGP